MREVNVEQIVETVKNLSIEANYFLGSDIKEALKKSREEETYRCIIFSLSSSLSAFFKRQMICSDTLSLPSAFSA